MKLCTDCKRLSGGIFCKAPENGISRVDGEPNPRFSTLNRAGPAAFMFFDTKACGPEAIFFTPKEPPEAPRKPWWKRIFNK